MSYGKKLTNKELIEFLKNNKHGILALSGRTPYALPMGYIYREKTLLLCLTDEGKKMERIRKNRAVCYTICKPRWETEKLKTPCTSVVIEGKLEAVKDKSRIIGDSHRLFLLFHWPSCCAPDQAALIPPL